MDKLVDRDRLEAGAAEAAQAGEQARADAPGELERRIEEIVTRCLAEAQRAQADRFAQARAEAERVAGMSEDERRAYDAGAVREREEQLARREDELKRRELRAWAVEELVARGLPRELEQVLDCGDEQRCRAGVDALEKAFRAAVQRGVDERIGRGGALPRSNGADRAALTQRMRAAAGLKN